MVILFTTLGIITGWLLEMVGDYLLRFSSMPVLVPTSAHPRPALFRLNHDCNSVDRGFELLTAGVFAFLYFLHGLSSETVFLMAMYSFFALIALMDYKYHLILNVLTYPGLLVALGVNLFVFHHDIVNLLLGMAFGFGMFFLTSRVKPGGVGGGDVKLAALIGAALGFPNILWALIVAVAASAIAIMFLFVARQGKLSDTIPYAPFLSLGVMIVLLITL